MHAEVKILIVEDDDHVAEALSAFLGRAGYSVVRAPDGTSAMEALNPGIDVILLDLGLPDIDGIDLCRRIRGRSSAPVIMATARGQVQDRITGLHAGADDYIVKPYDARELVARIEAITRRSRPLHLDSAQHLRVDDFDVQIDLVGRQILVDGTPVDLTVKEFDIVAVLARYPGVAVPRDRIVREVWNTDWNGFGHSIEVHVASIRRKTGRGALIETVRGVGYRLAGF